MPAGKWAPPYKTTGKSEWDDVYRKGLQILVHYILIIRVGSISTILMDCQFIAAWFI